jgi:N-acetylmuramoyl-L-alanine amidase
MGKLTHLFIHCSATYQGQNWKADDIKRWHTAPKEKGGRGWRKSGYSDVILLDGTVETLHDFDADDYVESWEITNGARGWNGRSRHWCYIGGLDKNGRPADTRTPEQRMVMAAMIKMHIRMTPDIKIIGHNQVAAKACPSFDVPTWLREIGIPEKNIDDKNYLKAG